MSEQENHFTVFIRLPFNRGDFIDPPPVAWSATKERELWDIISRQSKSNEIDWKRLSNQFQVTQPFLLQQAAWLYERQLSQVRAQMRRMGNRQSATASPAPQSATGSVVATQATKRSSVSSRAPSRLSTQTVNAANTTETLSPATPVRSRTSLPFRSSTGAVASHVRGGSNSRPLSRKSSKDNETSSRIHSRRGSVQHQVTRSPTELEPRLLSSSEEDNAASKTSHRRPNPVGLQRRAPSLRKSQHARTASLSHQQVDEETEEDDSPAFLPFAATAEQVHDTQPTSHDPSATLRGGLHQGVPAARPSLHRNVTSERVRPGTTAPTVQPQSQRSSSDRNLVSSNSSISSSANLPPPQIPPPAAATLRRSPGALPTPLSPRQQAALAAAAGLSPRRRSANNHHHNGSESSPSMGSSFSDLDDASVTQSALEEALMSGMGSTATTGTGAVGALGSRVSGISQALRSRYFDPRGGDGRQ